MPVHFTEAEMADRRERAALAVRQAGLDALLMFKQESMYWLTGYDTFGFSMFQCMVLRADGALSLLTRAPDRGTALYTSNVTDIRVWADVEGMNPAMDLRNMLFDLGLSCAVLGVEVDSYGLKASNWLALEHEVLRFCERWEDASSVVQELRRTKSPAEITYIRRAAELADDAWDVAVARAGGGVSEADVVADMQDAILRGGGDYAGNELIIGSGPSALMVRYTSGRRKIGENDQLTLEWCGVQRRYHAAMMRTLLTGTASSEHVDMHEACVEALDACEAAIKPGATLGEVFEAHADALDDAGYRAHRMNACGYGMGAVYAPIWVDWPMIYAANPLTIGANQVYFLHMILLDLDSQRAMNLGHSVLVTDDGCERLSRSSLELVVK
ncbi:MAG: Xaa-Pro peptidase family protein [Actinomycetota bacterium]|nr:Xaa-Pro peptidase family protein [Actinomycetota bacterium]